MNKETLKRAFRLSLPVLSAYLFLGITYGLLASEMGLPMWVPVVMAMVVYSGSVEFLALTMLVSAFNPASAAAMALMVGARHVFYGISMLQRWRGAGWKKLPLIFWMSDETFAINFANGGSLSQQLWVSVLDWSYWVTGGIIGYLFGSYCGEAVTQYLQGLDFVVTAMFIAIFMDDFVSRRRHLSAWIGFGASVICLWLFGASRFIVPTMGCILLALYIYYRKEEHP
ncbi:MAG: AzlC family ABC transporter permease [Prevotella sp.]|nr:AzlC family ABC transporter permease [Prevotella sp.]